MKQCIFCREQNEVSFEPRPSDPELLTMFEDGVARVEMAVDRDFLGASEPTELTGARTDFRLLSATLEERKFEYGTPRPSHDTATTPPA